MGRAFGSPAGRRRLPALSLALGLGAVLTAGLLQAPTAAARIVPPEPVGKVTPKLAPKVAAGKPHRAGGLLAPAHGQEAGRVAIQATTCNTVNGFTRLESGQLFSVTDSSPLGTTASMIQSSSPIGSSWSGSQFAWTGAGGDGVLYALTWKGALHWYKRSGSGWARGSGTIIGTGFTPRTNIVNISVGINGRFYLVRANGSLTVMQHTGRLTGAVTWANRAGWTIGQGWTGDEIIIPTGDGTVYRQYKGGLYWYRHSDPAAGKVTWLNRRTLGSGWYFYDVLSAGGGVLYATSGGDGKIYQYQHLDPVNGANTWARGTGVEKMTADPSSFGVSIDPAACAAG